MGTKMPAISQNNENKSFGDTADEEDTMMEVDAQVENNTSAGFVPPNKSDAENKGEGPDIDKVLENYKKEPDTTNITVTDVAANTATNATNADEETYADDDPAYTIPGDEDSSDGDERNFFSLFNDTEDECTTCEENKSAVQLAQEQLFIDWCTSRQLLTEKDADE